MSVTQKPNGKNESQSVKRDKSRKNASKRSLRDPWSISLRMYFFSIIKPI